MTITLSAETEARLRERAEREQQDVNTLADALLAEALTEECDPLTAEEIREIRAGVRRGLDDCTAGRVQPVTEWAARLRGEFRLPTHLTDEQLGQDSA